jgi:hypothetical protein
MLDRRGQGSAGRVENDFVQADLDTAFNLLSAAETDSLSGAHDDALREIEEAEKAIIDGEARLPGINASDRESLRFQLTRMRAVIAGIRLNLK